MRGTNFRCPCVLGSTRLVQQLLRFGVLVDRVQRCVVVDLDYQEIQVHTVKKTLTMAQGCSFVE